MMKEQALVHDYMTIKRCVANGQITHYEIDDGMGDKALLTRVEALKLAELIRGDLDIEMTT